MRVAIVHELLTMRGGAEKVAKLLESMYPEADIYTILLDPKISKSIFPNKKIQTSSLQKWAYFLSLFTGRIHHHLFIPWMKNAVEQWNFSQYDLVISSSSAFAHGIITNNQPPHIAYLHAPMRYIWDRSFDVHSNVHKKFFGTIIGFLFQLFQHRTRIWDTEASERHTVTIAASIEVQKRCLQYWKVPSAVITPPISDLWFTIPKKNSNDFMKKYNISSEYYLIVSTLVAYKNIDRAIAAFNSMKTSLVIVGTGPYEKILKKMVQSKNIHFFGFQTEENLCEFYDNAKGLLFPGNEDFGLVPIEAMSRGIPVVALNVGGAKETIIQNSTGILYNEDTKEALITAIQKCDNTQWNEEEIKKHAKKFNEYEFKTTFKKIIEQYVH